MNRRGFLKLVGLAPALPLLNKVVAKKGHEHLHPYTDTVYVDQRPKKPKQPTMVAETGPPGQMIVTPEYIAVYDRQGRLVAKVGNC